MKEIKNIALLFILGMFFIALSVSASAIELTTAPGGSASDNEELLSALGGESAGWINDTGEICLKTDILLNAPIVLTAGNCQINGAGSIIERGFEKGFLITVTGDAVLNLGNTQNTDKEDTLIIDGRNSLYKSADSLICVAGGTLNIYSGVTIQGNAAAENGGGLFLSGNGTVNLYGGIIRECSAQNGGGIWMEGGTLNMSNGFISKCRADKNGGGVYIDGGKFTITGGYIGGSVTYSEYTSEAAVDYLGANSAMENGGGVYSAGGSCFLAGGYVSCNSAKQGGGVYNQNKSFSETQGVYVVNGAVTYNTAQEGGGIYNSGVISLAYAGVLYNKAVSGGGIYNAENAQLYMDETSVSSNEATGNGGGMYNYGVLEINSGTVNYNSTESYGGGLINYGSLKLAAGAFGYNKSQTESNGIICYPGGTLEFTNAVFFGGEDGVWLCREENKDSQNYAKIKLYGDLTCTTTVAVLTPVIAKSDGSFASDFASGRVLLYTEEDGKIDDYAAVFKVNSDDNGKEWIVNSKGILKKAPPTAPFWITVGTCAVVFVGCISYVLINKRNGRKVFHIRSEKRSQKPGMEKMENKNQNNTDGKF